MNRLIVLATMLLLGAIGSWGARLGRGPVGPPAAAPPVGDMPGGRKTKRLGGLLSDEVFEDLKSASKENDRIVEILNDLQKSDDDLGARGHVRVSIHTLDLLSDALDAAAVLARLIARDFGSSDLSHDETTSPVDPAKIIDREAGR